MKKYSIYRGDTFCKQISALGYKFQPNDILRIAILSDTITGNKLYSDEINIAEEKDSIIIEIPSEKTSMIQPGIYVLEFELTYSGVTKTQQFELIVKADGIYG